MDTMRTALTTPLPTPAYDLLAALIILLFAWRGAWRGLVRECSMLLSLAGSAALAMPVGSLVLRLIPEGKIPLSTLSPAALTLAIGGVLSYVLLRLALFLLAKYGRLNREWHGSAETAMQCGGALGGSIFGALFALTMGWYVLSMGPLSTQVLTHTALATEHAEEAPEEGTIVQRQGLLFLPAEIAAAHWEVLRPSFIGKIAERTNPVPPSIVRSISILTEVTRDPKALQRLTMYAPVQKLAQNFALQALMQNQEVRALAEKGDIVGLLGHPAVKQAMADPEVRSALEKMDTQELMKFLKTPK